MSTSVNKMNLDDDLNKVIWDVRFGEQNMEKKGSNGSSQIPLPLSPDEVEDHVELTDRQKAIKIKLVHSEENINSTSVTKAAMYESNAQEWPSTVFHSGIPRNAIDIDFMSDSVKRDEQPYTCPNSRNSQINFTQDNKIWKLQKDIEFVQDKLQVCNDGDERLHLKIALELNKGLLIMARQKEMDGK